MTAFALAPRYICTMVIEEDIFAQTLPLNFLVALRYVQIWLGCRP